MSDMISGSGTCLCDAVRITAKTISTSVGACHCNICRKWGGGPFLSVDCGTEVLFEGEQNISVFSSSEWAERGFCTQCGTHLFYRLKETNQHIMPVGLFSNGDQAFTFDHQVFIEERPAFYCFANKTNDMTGAELFAKYLPIPE
ncbi:GFA family protein [Methyloprofundus sp.]|uniref:GFA family protein n=1 Tax=Methyloprofundus sp. TaxID=2020875 RepID=UPI003D0A19C9